MIHTNAHLKSDLLAEMLADVVLGHHRTRVLFALLDVRLCAEFIGVVSQLFLDPLVVRAGVLQQFLFGDGSFQLAWGEEIGEYLERVHVEISLENKHMKSFK